MASRVRVVVAATRAALAPVVQLHQLGVERLIEGLVTMEAKKAYELPVAAEPLCFEL